MHNRTQHLELPPPAVRGLIPELRPKIEEVDNMRAKAAAARGAEAAARREVERVEAGDRQAAANAARGKGKAGKPGTPAAREALDRAVAQAEVLALATADAERELADAVAEHRAGYEPALAAERQRATEEMRETATKLAAMEAERRRVRALSDWLRTPNRFAPEKFPARPLGLQGRGGEPYRLEEVIAAIVESLTKRRDPAPEGGGQGGDRGIELLISSPARPTT
jgi:hypothetical protein